MKADAALGTNFPARSFRLKHAVRRRGRSFLDRKSKVARLTRELDEAREQQTAMSEVLRNMRSGCQPNQVLQNRIGYLLKRPVRRPPTAGQLGQ